MIDNTLVSVVIPFFNVEDYFLACLESIVNQSYKNIELILVDDGSTDNSVTVAKSYLEKTKLNWHLYSQENKGQAAARNHGIRKAKGEWVICPDSDDFIVQTMIERLLSVAQSTGVDCVFSNFKYVTEESLRDGLTKEDTYKKIQAFDIRKAFFNRSLRIAAPATFLRRHIFDFIEYDETCPYTEDTHFIWKLLYEVNKVAYVTGDYYNYLMRNTSTVHTLKSDKYLKTSQVFSLLSRDLSHRFPNDYFAEKIAPRQRLGSLRMLALCNNYEIFKETVLKDGYRRDMEKLLFCKYPKISLNAWLFCASIKLYYKLANTYHRY